MWRPSEDSDTDFWRSRGNSILQRLMVKEHMKQRLLEAVVKEMQIGVMVTDADKRFLYANPFFEKTFSHATNPEGKNLSEVVKDRAVAEVIDRMLISRAEEPQEIAVEGKDGHFFEARLVPFSLEQGNHVAVNLTPTRPACAGVSADRSARSRVLIGFFHDVTEEKRVEAIKRDFVANVSHELRTPLASIKGYAETLLDGAMDDKATLKNFLTIIDRHANRMTALIGDLLTLSMLESHQMPMSFESLDIKELIQAVIQGLEKQAADKGISLSLDVRGRLAVNGDRDRLEQVMVNLIDNAIKYTNKGTVKVTGRKDGNMLRMDVEDSGIGIPEKDLSRIFERFYRVDKGRSRELGGTGLGLAIVKHIIQGHNGKIWVSSRHGKGSTFSFTIPIKR
ncbi:MAG: ATP-binding protein [Deltaproteobacteria bacterium]|nr:ATP-binding protein [Deltaproteobacteria bacterium]